MKSIIEKIKNMIKRSKVDLGALYLAYKRKDVPWYAKMISIMVVGYALSPIDLIPDFIPVLGYLDDAVIIPLGIYIAVRLIPSKILNECRKEAEVAFSDSKPKGLIAAAIIVLFWIALGVYVISKIIY